MAGKWGKRPDDEAIAKADRAKVVSPDLKEWRHQRAALVAKAIREARAKKAAS